MKQSLIPLQLSTKTQSFLSKTQTMMSPILFLFSLLLSLPLLFFFLSPKFKSPLSQISPEDELSDSTLFRRAIAHRPVSRLSSTNSPKIAFLFLTNTPLHFSPLWQKYFTQNANNKYNIYVHADPSAGVPNPGGVFSGRFVPAKRTLRGTPTLISAARRLIATAIIDDPMNHYFTLVSQHCVPLHSLSYTYKALFSNRRTESNRLLPSRLSYIEILSGEPQLRDRYDARGPQVMLPEIKFDDFRVGSQFFTLTRKHAMTVIKDRKLWNKFKLPCLDADTCYPEEHYFPTLLNMVDPDGCSKYTLTRVNWTGSTGGHPYMYRQEEISADLIRELRVSNSSSYSYLFARKFSPECLGPLMDLADRVIFLR